ncbi:MAG: hypothetical protein PHT13_00440 [Methanosarcina sp.]|nr:hypothetical protein [Methanosarcina sp.]
MKIRSGGYGIRNLPEEYLKAEHFCINKRSITFYSRVNPLNGEVSQRIEVHRISLAGFYSSMQIERIVALMRIFGERLCKIKENKENLAAPRFEEI